MTLEARENELQAQVQKLQNEIRFMKRWGAIAAVALLALVVGLRASDHRRISTQQVIAKDFVLIDSDDRARVRMAVFPEGSGMESYAASGEHRVQLELKMHSPGLPSLELGDLAGNRAIVCVPHSTDLN